MRFPQSSSNGRRNGYHLRAFSSTTVFQEKRNAKERPSILLSVFHGRSRKGIHPWERLESPGYGFIAPTVDDVPAILPEHYLRTCRVLSRSIKYERIQGWLNHCQNAHEYRQNCGRRPAMRIPLTCIDCFNHEIVKIASDDEYLALSYVWGSPDVVTPNNDSQVSIRLMGSVIPQTIEDAMNVVKSLGKRYLWVDKYCIDQKDMAAKHYQIQHMDGIYEGALLTIVAASTGEDASSGLPGVGNISRKLQPSACLADRVLSLTLPPVRETLEGSTWITRGWTYQEGALSRRCLFFTELQVNFVCSAMSCSEAIVSRGNPTVSSESLDGIISAEIFGKATTNSGYTKPGTPLRKFADHITQYTGRKLINETDVMHAFRGLLAKSQFHSYYGIPIGPTDWTEASSSDDFDYGFARGLFWLPNSKDHGPHVSLSRRIDFPSWSWVGWKGTVMFPVSGSAGNSFGLEALMKLDHKAFDARFWVLDKNGKRFTLAKLCTSDSRQRLVPEISSYIEIESWVLQFRFQPRFWSNDAGLYICSCHPNSGHTGTAVTSVNVWGDVTFSENALKKDD